MKRDMVYIRMFLLLLMFTGLAGAERIASTVWLGAAPVQADDVFDRLEQEAGQPVVETRMDPVWYLISGLQGRVIDRERTLSGWRRSGWQASEGISRDFPGPVVWKTVNPAKTVDDYIGHPIYRGNHQQQAVSFLINVAWGEEHLSDMLNIFRREEVKVTFMLEGKWANKHPELVRQMVSDGHEIGNHSYSHPQMDQLSRSEIVREISRTEDVLRRLTGRASRWFAPPSGAYDQKVLDTAASMKLHTVLWTADTVDWKKPPAEKILQRIQPKIEPGALVLMHPTAQTATMLPELIRFVKIQKLQLVTLEKMFSTERISGLK